MLVHIVQMFKTYGDVKEHYILGVYSDLERAKYLGRAEELWRAGRYCYHIQSTQLDTSINKDLYQYHKAREAKLNEISD